MSTFISRGRNFSVGIRSAVVEHYATGQEKVIVRGLEAQFEPRGITEEDVKQAISSNINFRGLPEDRDTGADVSPRLFLGKFDSEQAKADNGWTDEEHDLVVDGLRADPGFGRSFIEVFKAPATVPWAGYDQLGDAERIVELALATQTPLDVVIAYELENRNRVDVLELLELHLEDDPAAEITVAT